MAKKIDVKELYNATVTGPRDDPFLESAEWKDGTELTEDELEQVARDNPEWIEEVRCDGEIAAGDAMYDAYKHGDFG
jgi:hypothetical protein